MEEPGELFDKEGIIEVCAADSSPNENMDFSKLLNYSSSLNYLLVDIEDKEEWNYYSENAVLPTPDSCISGMDFFSKMGSTYLYIAKDANSYYSYYAYMLVVIDGYDVFRVVNNGGEEYYVYYDSEYIASFDLWYDRATQKTYLAVSPKRIDVTPVEGAANELEPIIDFLCECYSSYVIDSSEWEYFEDNDAFLTPESCVKNLVQDTYDDTGFFGLCDNSEILFLTYQMVLAKECGFRIDSGTIYTSGRSSSYTYSAERNTLYMNIN
ncbi:MAG: hypothetical protein LUI87_06345 [Lachnospiraceae bacterium]|nr:hypothetical protein [Lachnospiraceae bacterium]